MEHSQITEAIIGRAMHVHSALGAGFLEEVYHKALEHALRKIGLGVRYEEPIAVHYDGAKVGDFFADLLVECTIIVEVKAVLSLVAAHEAQLVNYLNATGIEVGVLVNFGGPSLEFKRKYRKYRPKQTPASHTLATQKMDIEI